MRTVFPPYLCDMEIQDHVRFYAELRGWEFDGLNITNPVKIKIRHIDYLEKEYFFLGFSEQLWVYGGKLTKKRPNVSSFEDEFYSIVGSRFIFTPRSREQFRRFFARSLTISKKNISKTKIDLVWEKYGQDLSFIISDRDTYLYNWKKQINLFDVRVSRRLKYLYHVLDSSKCHCDILEKINLILVNRCYL